MKLSNLKLGQSLLIKAASDAKWGFDLTNIKADDWKKILDFIGFNYHTEKPKFGSHSLAWIWQGKTIKIHTDNDPISGKYSTGKRKPEKDYASYIGIYGKDKKEVAKVAKMIRDLAISIKDETPNESRFI